MSINFNLFKVGFVNLTVGHWDLMNDHIKSIYDNYPYDKNFYIIPNIEFELSLAAALNKGFKLALKDGCDYIAYCADDTVIGEDCIQELLRNLIDRDLLIAIGTNVSASWDCFVIKPEIFDVVGYWEEGFYPAYFEDNCYARTIDMKAPDRIAFVPANFVHIGSQTVNRFSKEDLARHHEYFDINRQRYIAMWGGPPGKETYAEPWNGTDGDMSAKGRLGPFRPEHPERYEYPNF